MRSCRSSTFMFAVFAALFALMSFSGAFAAEPGSGAITEAKKIYRCYPGYDPVRCEVVYQDSTANSAATAGLAKTLAATPAGRVGGDTPLAQCGAGKGHSACCKIVGYLEDGSVIIECVVPNAVSASAATDPVADSIYECRKDLDGVTRCRKIRADLEVTVENLEKFDLAEVLAVSRTVKTGVPTPILDSDSVNAGPIAQCGAGHGQSTCCKIIAGDPGDTVVYIECGRRGALPTSGPITNKPPACTRYPGDTKLCPKPL